MYLLKIIITLNCLLVFKIILKTRNLDSWISQFIYTHTHTHTYMSAHARTHIHTNTHTQLNSKFTYISTFSNVFVRNIFALSGYIIFRCSSSGILSVWSKLTHGFRRERLQPRTYKEWWTIFRSWARVHVWFLKTVERLTNDRYGTI
jgi:hypothetical protein